MGSGQLGGGLLDIIAHHTEFTYGLDFSLHEPGVVIAVYVYMYVYMLNTNLVSLKCFVLFPPLNPSSVDS